MAEAASVHRKVVASITLLLPVARALSRRSSDRPDLVFRLRLQHARQCVSGPTRHATVRVAIRPRQRLSAALQSGRQAGRQGRPGEFVSRPRSGGLGRALSHNPTRSDAFGCDGRSAGEGLSPRGDPGRRQRGAARSAPSPTWPKAGRPTANRRSATSLCCETALARMGCRRSMSAFWTPWTTQIESSVRSVDEGGRYCRSASIGAIATTIFDTPDAAPCRAGGHCPSSLP